MSEEALARIEEAKQKRDTRLDLSDLDLRQLPPEISSLAQLLVVTEVEYPQVGEGGDFRWQCRQPVVPKVEDRQLGEGGDLRR